MTVKHKDRMFSHLNFKTSQSHIYLSLYGAVKMYIVICSLVCSGDFKHR